MKTVNEFDFLLAIFFFVKFVNCPHRFDEVSHILFLQLLLSSLTLKVVNYMSRSLTLHIFYAVECRRPDFWQRLPIDSSVSWRSEFRHDRALVSSQMDFMFMR